MAYNAFTNSGATTNGNKNNISPFIGGILGIPKSSNTANLPNPTLNTPQTKATQTGLLNNKTFNAVSTPKIATKSIVNSNPVKSTPINTNPVNQNNPVNNVNSNYNGIAGNSINNITSPTTSGMINNQPNSSVYKNDSNLYGNLVTGLANTPQTNEAVNKANQELAQLQTNIANQNKNIETSGIDTSLATGQEGVLNKINQIQLNTAQNKLSNALTQQQLQQSALNQAAGFAQPQLAGYNQQVFNPLTGNLGNGGNLNDIVQQVAEKVKSGEMTYADAQNALSGYGQGGTNALLAALPTGFNVAQSNTLANQQGSIIPAYNFAKSALDNLKSIADKLSNSSYIQGSNIPLVNSVGNFLSSQTGVNADLTRQYTGAIQEARNAYAQLLAASKGGTPTEYTGQSTAAIPDNATPKDIQAAINNLESLGQSKVNIYSNPGTSNNQSQNNGGTMFGSFFK